MNDNVILKEISNFISDEISDKIIESINLIQLKKMTVIGKDANEQKQRIAEGVWLPHDLEYLIPVREKIAEILNTSVENFEKTHIVKYNVGGEYKHHHDYFKPASGEQYNKSMLRGGQRKYSALIYLNDNFTGGETDFPKINKTIKPEKNKLIIWRNIKENGELEYDSFHAGLPVLEGIKYILVIWVREGRHYKPNPKLIK